MTTASTLITVKSNLYRSVYEFKSFIVIHKVEIITSITELLVSHPFILLRRQSQVQSDLQTYHLTPVTLAPVIVTLIHRHGFKILFKGMFSVILLRITQFLLEKSLSKTTGWPSDPPPTWYINKEWLFHFLLKISSYVITSPLYYRSVVNTVAISKEIPENFIKTRYELSLPFWQIMIPVVACGVIKYAFKQAISSFSAALIYLNLCFDESGRNVCQRLDGGIAVEDRQDILLKASTVSHFSAEIMFYPLEAIAHRLILQGSPVLTHDLDSGLKAVQIFSTHDGFFDCYDNILWLEGKLGLYKGLGALFMQAFVNHYSIKIVSCIWHSIRIFTKTLSRYDLNSTEPNKIK